MSAEISFQPDPQLFPFKSRYLETRAGRVHYIDEGEGPPILLLHGNPTWSFLYRGIVIRLRSTLRCIALDYPGFGLSDHPAGYRYTPGEHAEVVREVVQALDLQGLTIMGQDWGGPIGMRVALDEAHRMHALVMGNTWYWPSDAWQMKAFSAVMSSNVVQGWIYRNNFFVERVMRTGLKHKMAPAVFDHYRQVLPTADSRAGVAELPRQITRARGWLSAIADDVPRKLGHLPLLLPWGIEDFAFTPAFIDRFRLDFPHAQIRRLEAKHYIQEDAPKEISEAILEFLTP